MTNPKEIVNRRNMERLCFYNDQSGTGGSGRIQCDIWDFSGNFVGNFPADGAGIGGVMAADGLIGAMMTRNPTSMIEVRFPGGAFRSYDDGRTWKALTTSSTLLSARRALLRRMYAAERN